MGTARLFFVGSLFSYRALFHWLNPSAYLFQKMGFPLVQLAFFAFVGRFGGAQPLDFYLLGNAMIVGFQAMFSISSTISDERWQGTLPYLIGSPANRVVLFFGRGSVHALDALVDLAAAFLFAIFLFGLDLSHATWTGMLLAILVASLSSCAFGLFLGAAAYLVLDAAFLGNLALFAIVLLTGANVPLAELPSWAQAISWTLPLTRTVAAARGFAAGGPLLDGLPLLAADLGVGLAWGLAGFALFRWLETQARRRGTLEGF